MQTAQSLTAQPSARASHLTGPANPLDEDTQEVSECDLASVDNQTDHPRKKQRKRRQYFSCAECRRLKLKCDRQVPCANCIRRSCGDLCPHGLRTGHKDHESAALEQRLEALESILTVKGIHLPDPSAKDSSGSLKASARQPPQTTVQPPIPLSRISPHPVRHASSPSTGGNDAQQFSTGVGAVEAETSTNRHVEFVIPENTFDHMTTEASRLDFCLDASSIGENRPTGLSPGEETSFGTLVIGQGGRSKWLGPTAASEWLRDQETQESLESTGPSRCTSPERRDGSHSLESFERSSVFPFDGTICPMRTKVLLSRLPPIEEAKVLVDSYFRYFAWHYNIVTRTSFESLFDRVYESLEHSNAGPFKVDHQELALLYILLAHGALHSLELPPNDPSADEYLALSKSCLAKGDFLPNNTLAGVQTLHIMAHFHLETERGRNGDSAWPLWGLALRIAQAMGLHRDGERWNLPSTVVEERRRVFWESHAADIFQANCFSRPSTVSPDHIDTALPHDFEQRNGDKGFSTLKFELCQISGRILDQAMKVQAPPYTTIMDLHSVLCSFEQAIPFHMRCRSALLALPSVYPDQSAAIKDSPEVFKRNLSLSFQQCTLAINVSETILFLHRPYYAKALYSEVKDPTRSIFGPSYLAVIERCNAIIATVVNLYSLYPSVCARHWFLWYHVFNCGVVMGTLVLRNPANALAGFALSQIDNAIALYTSVSQSGSTKRMNRNFEWLVRLRARIHMKINRLPSELNEADRTEDHSDEEDVGLIGWRTRLIERAGKDAPKAMTISSTPPNINTSHSTPSSDATINRALSLALQQHFTFDHQNPIGPDQISSSSSNPIDKATDQLLHQFWDPMMMQEIPEAGAWNFDGQNWWDWENIGTKSGDCAEDTGII